MSVLIEAMMKNVIENSPVMAMAMALALLISRLPY